MVKRILSFCRISITSAPVFFVINLSVLLIMALSSLGMSYSFKLATDTILHYQGIGTYSVKIMLPILLFFLMICIGGNTGNFEEMMITAYTKRSKKLIWLLRWKSCPLRRQMAWSAIPYLNLNAIKW
jgi:hypothetical protein